MKENGQINLLKRLFVFTRPYIKFMILSFIFSTLSVSLALLAPVFTGNAIDYIGGQGNVNFNKITEILIRLAFAIGFSAFFQWLMTFCTNKITFYTVNDLRDAAFDKISHVPLTYIDGNSHGDIMNSVVNDIDQISNGLLQGFAGLFTGIITILGTLIFMLTINGTIALFVVVLTPLSLFVASFIAKMSFQRFNDQAIIQGKLSGYLEEMLGNQKIVKAFRYEERAETEFSEMNQKLYDCGVKAGFYSSLVNPSTRLLNGVVYAVVGIVGSIFTINGHLSIGQLSSFLVYANQYTKPFNEISGVVTELQTALASARRVFALIDEPIEISDENLRSEVHCNGTVNLEDVYFSYSKDKKLIEALNLDVKAGQKIAIVGPTGCGKTTIINLLMRFYDIDSGKIMASGVPVDEMRRKTLRGMYGMVLQETWLYNGSVRDNIAYGKEDALIEEIEEAAKQSYAHGFIERLPQGYDTIISEDGGNISQGQRQLLCIARVMLTKPPMLILDEATSNIDTRTESRIQNAFNKLMEGRTSFVVAHRLSTIKEADVILVMDQGRIIEQGTHETLLEKNGFYANLYNSQFTIA